MKKKFVITVDAEGDNQWGWNPGDTITTENAKYIPRFQALCEKYGFIPVYLTNYEMAADEAFAAFLRDTSKAGLCEIGMHLHAWNSPPDYTLERGEGGQPYLLEYPAPIMREKIGFLTDFIERQTGVRPTTHRAGRWAMNPTYFDLLMEHGYQVDCSVTPGVNMTGNCGFGFGATGPDYRRASTKPYVVQHTVRDLRLLEIPMTVRIDHSIPLEPPLGFRSMAGCIGRGITGERRWLRPNGVNAQAMLNLLEQCLQSTDRYAMFMIHSSELMPGGSPYFINEEAVESLYADLETLFCKASESYEGIAMRDFLLQSGAK